MMMTKLNLTKGTVLAATAALAMATPAAASVYTYTMTNGSVLTINSATATGTMIGSGINATFTSADFSTFTGGDKPNFMTTLTSLTGSRSENGATYLPNLTDKVHPPILKIGQPAGGEGKINLWAIWTNAGGASIGDYLTTIKSYTPPSSTGGTDVPAPAMPILLGLGALGLAYRARRVKARALITA
jgi:hypothetical protein